MNKRSWALAAAVVLTVLSLGGCGGWGPAGGGAGTTQRSLAAATSRNDNGIASRPVKEIVAASRQALLSARSVQVELDYKDKQGLIRMNLRLSRNKDAAGWVEQAGTRVHIVATGGRFYIRSPKLWRQQAPAEVASMIGDRWVLAPSEVIGEVTPFSKDLSIAGLADQIFDPASVPTFVRKSRSTADGRPAVRLQAIDGSYYIAGTGKPYPLRVDGIGDHQDITFSRYDQIPAIRPPRGALDLERLGG